MSYTEMRRRKKFGGKIFRARYIYMNIDADRY
jgi:hypothetical protein